MGDGFLLADVLVHSHSVFLIFFQLSIVRKSASSYIEIEKIPFVCNGSYMYGLP